MKKRYLVTVQVESLDQIQRVVTKRVAVKRIHVPTRRVTLACTSQELCLKVLKVLKVKRRLAND